MSQNKPTQARVKYETTSALFAGHFIVNAGPDELIIDFSSGPIQNSHPNESILPIHTRIALTTEAAKRLSKVLAQALDSSQGHLARFPDSNEFS